MRAAPHEHDTKHRALRLGSAIEPSRRSRYRLVTPPSRVRGITVAVLREALLLTETLGIVVRIDPSRST